MFLVSFEQVLGVLYVLMVSEKVLVVIEEVLVSFEQVLGVLYVLMEVFVLTEEVL